MSAESLVTHALETNSTTNVRETAAIGRNSCSLFTESTMTRSAGDPILLVPGLNGMPRTEDATALKWFAKPMHAARLGDDVLNQGDLGLAVAREWLRIVSSDLVGSELINALRAELAEMRRLEEEAIARIQVAARPLEVQWSQLHAFFQQATLDRSDEQTSVPVQLVDVHAAQLLRNDAQWTEFSKRFLPFDTLNHDELVSLFVFTEPIHEIADLQRVGSLAERTAGLAIVPFPRCDWDEAVDLFQPGRDYEHIKRIGDSWCSHVMYVGNEYSVRRATQLERRSKIVEPLFVSSGPLLAGKILRGDEVDCVAIPQVGPCKAVSLKTRDGSKVELCWPVRGKEDAARLNKAVVLLMWRDNQLVFWGIESLAKSELVEAQYSVKRTKSYLEKVIAHMLDGYAFAPKSELALQEALNRYLRSITGAHDPKKLIAKGLARVLEVPESGGKELRITLDIAFKVATERFLIEIRETTLTYEAKDGADGKSTLVQV